MRKSNQLTVKTIEKLIRGARASGKTLKKCDGNGLWFLARPDGYWIKKYQTALKTRDMGLGPYPLIGLAEARAMALEADRLRLKGLDPIAERQRDRRTLHLAAQGMSLKDATEQYLAAHRGTWRSAKHARQWESSLRRYAKTIADRPIQSLTTQDVLDVLTKDDLWSTKTSTMDRVRLRLERVIDFARAAGHSTASNPARWKSHLDKLLPAPGKIAGAKVEHMVAMPYAAIPTFMQRLRARDGVPARALEMLILCASRTKEINGMRWDELVLDAALEPTLWVIPASRMKAGKEHRVPLSPRAVEILTGLSRTGEYVFSLTGGNKPLSADMLRKELRRAGEERAVVHGMRSTFADWARDRHVSSEVIESSLAHVDPDRTRRAYQRSDLFKARAQLMQQWAAYLDNSA